MIFFLFRMDMDQDLDVLGTCSICLIDFTKEEIKLCQESPLNATLCILRCNHIYHPQCIQRWLLVCDSTTQANPNLSTNRKKTCPSCRVPDNRCQHEFNSPLHYGSYIFDAVLEFEKYIANLESKLAQTQPLFDEMYELDRPFIHFVEQIRIARQNHIARQAELSQNKVRNRILLVLYILLSTCVIALFILGIYIIV